MLQYHQESYNSYCLNSFTSALHIIGENKATTYPENTIKESLTLQSNKFRNRIDFVNDIMKYKLRHKGEQYLRYNVNKWKNKYVFDILNDISENFTSVQLMDTLVYVNHYISIVGY